MAPEMIICGEKYSEKIDMWSFGCIWYFLIKGSDMFNAQSVDDILNSITNAT